MKREGKKALNIDVPTRLYAMFAKLCIDMGVTKTEAITRYLEFLEAKYHRQRRFLDAESREEFNLKE